jgi:hypothetical protein
MKLRALHPGQLVIAWILALCVSAIPVRAYFNYANRLVLAQQAKNYYLEPYHSTYGESAEARPWADSIARDALTRLRVTMPEAIGRQREMIALALFPLGLMLVVSWLWFGTRSASTESFPRAVSGAPTIFPAIRPKPSVQFSDHPLWMIELAYAIGLPLAAISITLAASFVHWLRSR